MRRNLVGKKLPQQLTIRETYSVTENWTAQLPSTIQNTDASRKSGWVPSAGFETNVRDKHWVTEVTPFDGEVWSIPQANDLIAVSFVDTLHSSGVEDTMHSGGPELVYYTKLLTDPNPVVCDNSSGGSEVAFALTNATYTTRAGQIRLHVTNIVGDVRLKVQDNSSNLLVDVPLKTTGGWPNAIVEGIELGTDTYTTRWYNADAALYNTDTEIICPAGASCTVKLVGYDEDAGYITAGTSSEVVFASKPYVVFVDDSTGEMHTATPLYESKAQPIRFFGNGDDTWAKINGATVGMVGLNAVYRVSDIPISPADIRVYVTNDTSALGFSLRTDRQSLWSTNSNLAFVSEGQLRRSACSALIGTGGTFDGDLEIQAGWGYTFQYDVNGEWLEPTANTDDLRPNGFTANSLGISMGAVAFVAPSLLTDYNYISPPSSYYPDGETLLDSRRPSQVADVYQSQSGDVGNGPSAEAHQFGIWKQECWISLEDLDVNTKGNPTLDNVDHWQLIAGAWSFSS